MPRLAGRPEVALLMILTAYAGLSLAANLATPLGEGPDEPEHFAFVQYLREEGRLPIAPASVDEGMRQAKHPPLYYAAAALISLPWDLDLLGFRNNPFFAFRLGDSDIPNAFLHGPRETYPSRDAPEFLAARAMRLVSLFCGLLTVCAAWGLARQLRPEQPALAWLAASLMAFLPGFVFGSAVFSNDAAANAFSALGLLAAVLLARPQSGRPEALLAGLCLGLALLSKLTTLPLVGVLGLALLFRTWRSRQAEAAAAGRAPSWPTLARPLLDRSLWMLGSAALVSGWWFARNMWLYGWDDPLGWKRFNERAGALARIRPLSEEILQYLQIQLESFWGWFGWMSLRLPEWQYKNARFLLVLAAIGLLVFLLRSWRGLSADSRWGLVLVAAAVGMSYLSVFRLAFDFNLVVAHGRLLYTALAGIALLVATGLLAWIPERGQSAISALLCLGLFGHSLQAVVLRLEPAYRLPSAGLGEAFTAIEAWTDQDLQIQTFPAAARFDKTLELIEVQLHACGTTGPVPSICRFKPESPEPERPGVARAPEWSLALEPFRYSSPWNLHGNLHWRSLPGFAQQRAGSERGLLVFVHLVDAADRVVARWEGPPFRGRFPFEAWPEGSDYSIPFSLSVDPLALPGLATLHVGVYPEDQPNEALLLGDTERLRSYQLPLLITERARSRSPGGRAADDAEPGTNDALALFGASQQLGLVDLQMEPPLIPGRAPDPLLYWNRLDASDPLDPGLGAATVFVHWIDADGQLLATADGPPVAGRYPIAWWNPGNLIKDRHVLPQGEAATATKRILDAGKSGGMSIRIGLYDPSTGQRFPAFDAAGRRLPEDAYQLGVDAPIRALRGLTGRPRLR